MTMRDASGKFASAGYRGRSERGNVAEKPMGEEISEERGDALRAAKVQSFEGRCSVPKRIVHKVLRCRQSKG